MRSGLPAAQLAILAVSLPGALLFTGLVLAGVLGMMSLTARNEPYDQIVRPELARDRQAGPGGAGAPPAPGTEDAMASPAEADLAERELEIRQLLEARHARMLRRGGPGLDVEAEVARLLSSSLEAPPEPDAERDLEIRQMLEARSARLVRRGGEPLDIDAELARLHGGEASAAAP